MVVRGLQATIGNRAVARLALESTTPPSRVLARLKVSEATRALEQEARAVAERLLEEIGLGGGAARAVPAAPALAEGAATALTIAGVTLSVAALATGWALLYERGARDWRTEFEAQARRSMVASRFPDCIGEVERNEFILTGHLLIPHECWTELVGAAGTSGAAATSGPQSLELPDREPVADTGVSESEDPVLQAMRRVAGQLDAERARVAETKRGTAPKEWRNMRAGATKEVYNLREQGTVLLLIKTFPNQRYLEQVHVVGVLHGETLISTKKISKSGKGRIADALEIEGANVTLIDFKSESTFLASISGGLSAPGIDATFRPKTEIATQHQVERDVLDTARRLGGTVLLKGTDPVTGEEVVIEIDPDRVSSRVTGYDDVGRH
jgi:hypothetical protein